MKVKKNGFSGVAGMISSCYGNRWAGYTIFLTAFLFLIPYVGIQIQGIAIFMGAAFPDFIPSRGWAVGIVVVMLIYSEIGGLKAIVYSDAIQGLLCFWCCGLLASTALMHLGAWQRCLIGLKLTVLPCFQLLGLKSFLPHNSS
jgi:SSS family solute:Na+ symporter